MIAATDNPRLLRVEFEQSISDTTKTVIVCFLHARIDGVRMYYSHHLLYSRPIPKGAWDQPKVVRMALSANLRTQIAFWMWHELWETFMGGQDISIAPFDPETSLKGLDA